MTTDPLAKKLQELKDAQVRVNYALERLNQHFQDHGCVREDLITELKNAHLSQLKAIGA